jgi:hypothetical protein
MKKTKQTESVQYLMSKGIDYKNAYRIIYLSKGTAATVLKSLIPEYLELRKASEKR